jgi:fused signal recognition particle receptor
LFESLKKKFNGTIGKISDKITEEEKLEASSEKKGTNKTTEKLESSDNSVKEKSDQVVEENTAESNSKKESDDNKSGIMGFLRGKSKESDEIKDDSESSVETDFSKLENPISDKLKSVEELSKDEEDEKSGIFSFVKHKTISEKDIDDILFELEMALLEGDVAMDVAEQIIKSVKEDLVGRKIKRRSDVSDFTKEALRKAISNILDIDGKDITSLIEEAKKIGEPLKIMFVGINGTGKTTTIAKISTYFIEKGFTPVIAASDTFRAGAIEQLTHHADKLGVKIIKHKKGADPAAVAYDAVEHARAKGKELVLIDTAGRMQTNVNLMDEMKKIKRVIKPDLIIYVGDALTGNDSVEQAQKFNNAVGIDGIILTKADADAKGGSALSIGYVIQKPILFLGTGQSYSDIIEFKPDWMVEQIIG